MLSELPRDDFIPLNTSSSFSKKKLFIHKKNPKYLLIDFEKCIEEDEQWYNYDDWHINTNTFQKFVDFSLNDHFKNTRQIPQIYDYDIKSQTVLTQNIQGPTILQLATQSAKFGIFMDSMHSAVNWLKKFQLYDYDYGKKNNDIISKRVYDQHTIMSEMNLFIDTCLPNFDQDHKILLLQEFSKITDNLNMGPCHRDFQSANLIYSHDEKKTYIIDFQDACIGPKYYDLVSLLYDLKIFLPELSREKLANVLMNNLNNDDKREILFTAIFRLCKSLTVRYRSPLNEQNTIEIKTGFTLLQNINKKLFEIDLNLPLFTMLDHYLKRPANNLTTIILGGGRGKRMGGDLPKILVPCLDIPMIDYTLRNSAMIGSDNVFLVVGYKAEDIVDHVSANYNTSFFCKYVHQHEQLGTGHAVLQTVPHLHAIGTDEDLILVLAGDVPTICSDVLNEFVRKMKNNPQYVAGILTTETETPDGCGRIMRNGDDQFIGSIEEKDIPTDRNDLREIREIGVGITLYRKSYLIDKIQKINCDNAQKEYYLPDVINLLLKDGENILAYCSKNIPRIHGANDKKQLAEIENWMSTIN